VTPQSLELFADPSRRLKVADERSRLLMLSCGATLHHLYVAIGADGWRAEIHRFPSPAAPTKLASITFSPQPPTAELRELARAIADRRSDRRPMSSWPVPREHLIRLAGVATAHGAIARGLDVSEMGVWNALAARADMRRTSPEYRSELFEWTHRHESRRDGVPPASRLRLDAPQASRANRFGPGTLPLSGHRDGDPQPLSLLLATSSDDKLGQLRAGEAMSAVLLDATRLGLATAIDSEALEMDATRSVIEERVLDGAATPQILLTIGWPSTADPLPATPRRGVREIVTAVTPDSAEPA
jgi:hypothetical protein